MLKPAFSKQFDDLKGQAHIPIYSDTNRNTIRF